MVLFASPGTYSISVRSDGPVDFHVYKSTDLSSPIERRGEATGRWTFNFPKGQFYIRVFARDRAWSGAYQLMVHQHAGKNPSDAIALFANQPIFQHFGETTWFRFPTEAPDSGQAQNWRIFINSVSPADTLTMDLFAADATTLIASSSLQALRRSFAVTLQIITRQCSCEYDAARPVITGWAGQLISRSCMELWLTLSR